MRTLLKYALIGAASLSLAGPANAAIITFSGLTSPGSIFTTLTEAGFIITRTVGTVNQSSIGNPAPAVSFGGFGGIIEITRSGGGTFSFAGFDLINSATPTNAGYFAQGFLGSSLVGFSTGAPTAGTTLAGIGGIVGTLDRLTINVNNLTVGQAIAASIDNINVSATVVPTVPEPATWGLMLAGFGLVGASLRRGKQAVRVKYA